MLAKMVNQAIRKQTLSYFWKRMEANTATAEEKQDWFGYITTIALESRELDSFYRNIIKCIGATAENVDKLLEFTDSVECRSVLLEYRKENTGENNGGF